MVSRDDQIRQYESDKATIIGLLNDYVRAHAHPCNWEQFEYWVSKEHGQGWHDEYQNILAEAALSLPCFEQNVTESGYDVRLTCKHCGRKWHYTSEEWRMLAYRNRLVPDDPRAVGSDLLIGGWFATAGFEPRSVTTLSIERWCEFMSWKTSLEEARGAEKRTSLLSRIWGSILGHS